MSAGAKWITGLLIVAGAIAALASHCSPEDAETSALRRTVAALQFTVDTMHAAQAQADVRRAKQNDSLVAVIAAVRAQAPGVVVRHDTAFVPESTWVFVTDTLVPNCERCAKRVDSLLAERKIDRRLTDSLSVLHRVEVAGLDRAIQRERRKSKLLPVALVGGAVLGAWLRGR